MKIKKNSHGLRLPPILYGGMGAIIPICFQETFKIKLLKYKSQKSTGLRPPPTYLGRGATTKILNILSAGWKFFDYLGRPCAFGGTRVSEQCAEYFYSCVGRNLRLRRAFSNKYLSEILHNFRVRRPFSYTQLTLISLIDI